MQCPLCKGEMSVKVETSGRSWFAGSYSCLSHGLMRMSGRILDDGEIRVTHWLPSCQEHGFAAVTQTSHDRFRCLACDTEIRIIHGNLQRFKPVHLISGRRAMAIL